MSFLPSRLLAALAAVALLGSAHAQQSSERYSAYGVPQLNGRPMLIEDAPASVSPFALKPNYTLTKPQIDIGIRVPQVEYTQRDAYGSKILRDMLDAPRPGKIPYDSQAYFKALEAREPSSAYALRRLDWYQQTNPEGVLKDQLKIQIADLGKNHMIVGATADECTTAERAMRNALDPSKSDFVDNWLRKLTSNADGVSRSPGLINAEGYRLVSQYKLKCAASLTAFVPDSALGKTVAQVMGALFHKVGGWGVVCSVTRVKPGLVLTARHCFYDGNTTTIHANLSTEIRLKKYKVLLPGMSVEMPVTGLRCADAADLASASCLPYSLFPSATPGFESDVILLEVKEPPGLAEPRVTLGSSNVRKGLPIMLVGWNLFSAIDAAYPHVVSPITKKASFKETSQLSMSRGGTCAVASVRNACITHTCQSTPGSSGAALFEPVADGSIRIVAIHVADMNATSGYMKADACDLDGMTIPENFYEIKQAANFGNVGRLLNR